MDSIIIPNWHPLLVHFTVALVLVSTLFLVGSKLFKSKSSDFETVGKWTLWLGALITVATLAAGYQAYNSVAHDDVAHAVMKVHRNWAWGTALGIFLLAAWVYKSKTISTLIVAASVLVSGAVMGTGYLGAELVYRHGLGVMRLPDTSGEGHAHADGAAHDHGSSEMPAAGAGAEGHDDGHAHDAPAADHHDDAGAAAHDHGEATEAEAHDHGDKATEGQDHAEEATTGHGHDEQGDSSVGDPTYVADALFAALKAGDEATVDKLLADDVLILEGGHAQQGKAEYMSGHMKSDMAYLPNISLEVLSREVGKMGNMAWITTHARTTGEYKGRTMDSQSREFMLLRHNGEAWKITLVQWSDK